MSIEDSGLLSPMLLRVTVLYLPALLNANHVLLAHLGPSIIVLACSLRKAEETVKLCANIASFAYGFCKWKDLLRQFMDDFQFSIFICFLSLGCWHPIHL
jgi:hypothetical protein